MKKIVGVFFLFFCTITFAQKEADFWYFGHKAGLDFSTEPPTSITDGLLDTFEGCSTISDADGKLLFYSDGTKVWSSNHQLMRYANGSLADNLLGNPSSTQSALVIPKPKNPNIYYLFTVGTQRNSGLNYYTIDITKNGGLGEVIDGPVDLSGVDVFGWTEKVTAVESADCDAFWVISTNTESFYSFKIDKDGVNTAPVKTDFDVELTGITRGAIKISPDGKSLVLANQTNDAFLFDFNDTDGTVSNKRVLELPEVNDSDGNFIGSYGVGFSQTSSMLYVSTGVHSQNENNPQEASIYQFNITNPDINIINNSRETISTETGFRGALQLGVNGKIYYARSRKSFLGVIHNPDKVGDETGYIADGIRLSGGSTSSEGLPPFIQSFFSPVNIVDSNDITINLNQEKQLVCDNIVLNMEPEVIGITGSTYIWTKNEDPTVLSTTSNISIDATNYGSGVYNLEMVIFDTCGRVKKYNGTVEVEFVPTPDVYSVPIYEQCDIDSNPIDGITLFNLQSKEGELTNNATGVNVEFFETSDTNFTNPILNEVGYINAISTITGNHKLIVRGTNIASGCQTFGEIELKANPSSLDKYPSMYLCEIDVNASDPDATNSLGSGDAFFNFDAKTNDIIANSGGAFSLTTHAFEYYRTANDAALQTNAIVTPYDDDLFVDNSLVFVRISTIGTNACSGIGQFNVFVNVRPIPQGNVNPIYLCVNNPIDNPQQITIDLDADTGIASDTYQWFLNGNLITGATSAIHKANVEGTYRVEAYRAYINNVADLTDDDSCIGYNTFTVIESNSALIAATDLMDNVDNPEANILTVMVTGIGTYQYALNSTDLSEFTNGDENLTFTFTNVKPGLNTVYVRDANGCGIPNSKQLSFLFFQRHFTPNNDGVYDTWKIAGVNNAYYVTTDVQIFDRFGKVVAIINRKDDTGWDGTFNGNKLPSSDYWFNAVLEDINGNIRKESGHFSLLRK